MMNEPRIMRMDVNIKGKVVQTNEIVVVTKDDGNKGLIINQMVFDKDVHPVMDKGVAIQMVMFLLNEFKDDLMPLVTDKVSQTDADEIQKFFDDNKHLFEKGD